MSAFEVTSEQYADFQRDGFLIVRQLLNRTKSGNWLGTLGETMT